MPELLDLLLVTVVGGCVGFTLRPFVDRWSDRQDAKTGLNGGSE